MTQASSLSAMGRVSPVLVHEAIAAVKIGISVPRLRDVPQRNAARRAGMRIARRALGVGQTRHEKGVELGQLTIGQGRGVDRAQAVLGPVPRRHKDDTLIGEVVVVGVAYHDAAVGRRAPGDDHGGAGRALGHGRQAQEDFAVRSVCLRRGSPGKQGQGQHGQRGRNGVSHGFLPGSGEAGRQGVPKREWEQSSSALTPVVFREALRVVMMRPWLG